MVGKKRKAKASKPDVNESLLGLDRQLIELLETRARLAAESGEAPRSAAEDERLRESLLHNYSGDLDARRIAGVLREVHSVCRAAMRPVRVAFLGPEHSYSHIATVERFGSAAELAPVNSIATVFTEVQNGRVDYGVAPIENSTDGRIVDTLSMLAREPIRISGEIQLAIHHCLLGKCRQAEVTEVYSKPQALSQCRDWLATNLPAAKPKEVASTALAAQMAAKRAGAAAIASRQAGIRNGLDVIVANIEDNPSNVTRFAVLGGEVPGPTGADKTTLMFHLPHEPGALADAMTIFKRRELNLTWIESFPMPGAPNEYVFFVEFEGHQTDDNCRAAMRALAKRATKLETLGSYPRSKAAES